MENNDITVILNCYRRPQYLRAQILAMVGQSVKPKEIWIWVNESEETKSFDWFIIDDLVEKHNIRIVSSNYNWKYCGRFSLACMVDTRWTAIFDDDTIPGTNWFANCLKCMEYPRPRKSVVSDEDVPHPILGGVGVVLHQDDAYQPNTRYGWVSANEYPEKVDLVGHAWFFPACYIEHMWRKKPMWDNGEDMHLSAMCQIYGGIDTLVPPHPKGDTSMWSSLHGVQLGVDSVASSATKNHAEFYQQRNECVKRLTDWGWKLCRDLK